MEMDELYWFLEYKPRTETRENIYIMTMVSREPRQIIGHVVSRDKTSKTIQKMVDAAPDAERYCTDGYSGYLDVIFPGKHIFNIHNKCVYINAFTKNNCGRTVPPRFWGFVFFRI